MASPQHIIEDRILVPGIPDEVLSRWQHSASTMWGCSFACCFGLGLDGLTFSPQPSETRDGLVVRCAVRDSGRKGSTGTPRLAHNVPDGPERWQMLLCAFCPRGHGIRHILE